MTVSLDQLQPCCRSFAPDVSKQQARRVGKDAHAVNSKQTRSTESASCPRDLGQRARRGAWARRAYAPMEHVSISQDAPLCPPYAGAASYHILALAFSKTPSSSPAVAASVWSATAASQ